MQPQGSLAASGPRPLQQKCGTGIAEWLAGTFVEPRALDLATGRFKASHEDGKGLFAGGGLGELVVLDVTTGRMLRYLNNMPYRDSSAMAFSPDGKRLTVGAFKELIVWNLEKVGLLDDPSPKPGAQDKPER